MTVYRCDRCGAIINEEKLLFGIRAGSRGMFALRDDEVIHMDLCPNCYESLIDWAGPNQGRNYEQS